MTLLLAVVMVFCLAACAEDPAPAESSAPATSSQAGTSEDASSEAPESSATEESSEAEPSTEPSEDESSEEPVLDYEVAEYITQYVSWKGSIGTGLVSLRGTDGTSIRLTALNTGVVDGVASIVAFNSDYAESTIESAEGT
jgi:hypothetical protein